MKSNDFSVLISTYKKDNPQFLQLALKSIWDNQTLKPNEIVIVKDGPLTQELDNVINVFCASAPTKIVPLEENKGLGFALNVGIQHCTHELIARMDTDDICRKDRFEKQIKLFQQNPLIDIASSWVDEFYISPENTIGTRKLPEFQSQINQYIKKRCPINHPSVMYKKSKVLTCGGYENIRRFEDYPLWGRMMQNGCIFHNIQESLVLFRINDSMYKNRGGFRYFIEEYKLQIAFYQNGMISYWRLVKNLIIRFFVRTMPNTLRGLIYKTLLR